MNARVRDSTIGASLVREAPRFALTFAESDLRKLITSFVHRDQQVAATLDFENDPGAARALFDDVNAERRARALPALVWDERLAEAGRAHAADMYRHGYFGHDTPQGESPGDRLRELGVPFGVTAENIALAISVEWADVGLFRSKEHRDHILSKTFTRLGVGVMYGRQGFLVAQEFAG
ncbi:MAG: CAP domain-containing protein [Actinomycetota bacterium]